MRAARVSELILVPPRELPVTDDDVRAGGGLTVETMDIVLNALDTTAKHLAYLKLVSDHCTSAIAMIALAHATTPKRPAAG